MEVTDRMTPATTTAESISSLARFSPLSPLEESKSFLQDQTSSAEEKSEEDMSSIISDRDHVSLPKTCSRATFIKIPESATLSMQLSQLRWHLRHLLSLTLHLWRRLTLQTNSRRKYPLMMSLRITKQF